MITASLFVIGVVAYVVSHEQMRDHLAQVRSQGVGLTRILGGMAWSELVPEQGRQGILQTLQHSQSSRDFAYGALIDKHGAAVSTVGAPGVVVPNEPLPSDPVAWLGERELQGARQETLFLEFHAPVFSAGELAGYVRLGYFRPAFSFDVSAISSVATWGLPVFLLTPLFYFLLRSETRPLHKMSENLEDILRQGRAAQVEMRPSGEFSSFISRFNEFVDVAHARIEELEMQHDDAVTSNKLLAYRQGKVESILQMLPEAILVLDEAGTVAYANQRVMALLGVDSDEIAGKRPRDWCADPGLLAYLSRRQGGHGQVGFISDTLQIVPEHAPDKVLEAMAYPLFSPRDEDSLLGNIVVVRDVTEQQVAKRSRSEFVAQVAHELKTPLNVLAMYSESLLGEEGNDEAFRVDAINVIHDEVERLAAFLNAMLAISQFELGSLKINKTRVRLPELLADAFANVSKSGRGDELRFEIDVPREMSALHVDKDLLRIAVNNLLTNAIKYNRTGGTVKLFAEESAEQIEIHVSDSGPGISESDQQRIFDKFFRSDDDEIRRRNGHGLGLSLARQIVSLHNGSLDVDSDIGVGSTFTIRLNKDDAGILRTGAA